MEKKLDILLPLLKSRTGPSIIYVTLQKHAEEVAKSLMSRGLPDVLVYHAGIAAPERQQVQVINFHSYHKFGLLLCISGNVHELSGPYSCLHHRFRHGH
jgi:superfamily II DNA helicase RecQ